jgi:GR25 family glycosyltransferase involved in LPS biosynthesis
MAYGVKFSTKNLSDEEIYNILIDFANHSKNYTYLQKQSKEYTAAMKAPSFIITYENNKGCVGYAITKKGAKYSLENIVPRKSGFIPPDIASEYTKTFVYDLRKFLKGNACDNMKVSLSKKKKLKLKDSISGKKTRNYFERYLNNYPLTHHPADIQRLNVFICAAHRYSRKAIDTDLLYAYLCNNLKWPEEEAKWCCSRIKTGLEILRVNKIF